MAGWEWIKDSPFGIPSELVLLLCLKLPCCEMMRIVIREREREFSCVCVCVRVREKERERGAYCCTDMFAVGLLNMHHDPDHHSFFSVFSPMVTFIGMVRLPGYGFTFAYSFSMLSSYRSTIYHFGVAIIKFKNDDVIGHVFFYPFLLTPHFVVLVMLLFWSFSFPISPAITLCLCGT